MNNYKHLSLDDRYVIQHSLDKSLSFKAIARNLECSPSTISKEVKKHLTFRRKGGCGLTFNNCLYRNSCTHSYICDNPSCKNANCRFCSNCASVCDDYTKEVCAKLSKPPYICNGCEDLKKCRLEKCMYSAKYAHTEYEELLRESRSGINADESDILKLDEIVSPLIQKGQSIYHICSNNKDSIMLDQSTIYNYVELGLFSATNLDLPRKVRYKRRKKKKDRFKVDKACRIGRTYEDFKEYMTLNPDTPVVEMDSVEGNKGGKVLLTIHFKQCGFMLAFLRDSNNSQSVIDIFDKLYYILHLDGFDKLFPLILTDNGSEFSNPSAIEFDAQGNRRTIIFYCDPCASFPKGSCEVNHELIRRVIPKGTSLDNLTQDDIDLMMNHVNSYGRKKLNTQSPYQVFKSIYGDDILHKLKAVLIPPNEIILKPKLLKY